ERWSLQPVDLRGARHRPSPWAVMEALSSMRARVRLLSLRPPARVSPNTTRAGWTGGARSGSTLGCVSRSGLQLETSGTKRSTELTIEGQVPSRERLVRKHDARGCNEVDLLRWAPLIAIDPCR